MRARHTVPRADHARSHPVLARLSILFEPFVVALLGTVVLASLLPARGAAVPWFDALATAGIMLLFFLHGAKLSRQALLDGVRKWQLHLAVFATTYALFPLLGLGLAALPLLDPALAAGILFLTLLPSTIQSSVAFTALAGGNVAAAVCSASFSNLMGILVTPALVAALMTTTGGGGMSIESIETILAQLLLPFVVGHALRPWIGSFVERRKKLVSLADRGSILMVVYTAFSAAVVEGLWQQVSGRDLALLLLVCCTLLVIALLITWQLGRAMGFRQEDAVVLLFCGSKKSLTSGVPMAGVLFPAAQVGTMLLPVMMFHQVQLIACAFIARHYARQAEARETRREG
jgi:solute carrier family 10 (sodium/bile acid cotransporter), member 7